MLPDFPTIVADESVDGRIVQLFQELGYHVISIAKVYPGISDSAVIEVALQRSGYIITEDKDFGDELVFKAPYLKVPTLLLRLSGISIEEKKMPISFIFKHHSNEIKESFSVLSAHKLRMRKFEKE